MVKINKLIVNNVNYNTTNNGKVLLSNTVVCNRLLGTNFVSKGNNLSKPQIIQVIQLLQGFMCSKTSTVHRTKRLPYGNKYRTVNNGNGLSFSTGVYKNRNVVVLSSKLLKLVMGL